MKTPYELGLRCHILRGVNVNQENSVAREHSVTVEHTGVVKKRTIFEVEHQGKESSDPNILIDVLQSVQQVEVLGVEPLVPDPVQFFVEFWPVDPSLELTMSVHTSVKCRLELTDFLRGLSERLLVIWLIRHENHDTSRHTSECVGADELNGVHKNTDLLQHNRELNVPVCFHNVGLIVTFIFTIDAAEASLGLLYSLRPI
ncbi:hypothetical protein AKJ16_DCAP22154 [Drosera capensis]